ncbi:UPF0587 protein C1orf123 homolog [Pogonomyrmex barbatus]|uniref:UPF0587 protein C1orf123 homolog n=1 Tax=Pogonomyrmex barbatus TaxID=144034 RepID=A0A6I9X9U0_9HYME|nr:UPF0587 protein C1orf123 homolog [Pogonomyrmex barbatus]XP_011641458.1 UPF0587 protein C1orf123 homolog [Pogonomyrmex barbatus]XP_011641459.1 UPF0587 protein C1orf123 homolog [Pogonomyrmex barbatus]
MVKIALCILFKMNNVKEVRPEGRDFQWCLKFVCTNCSEKSDTWNYLSLDEEIPMQRGSGVNHFVSKCKLCSRENSVMIIEDSIKSYTAKDQDQYKPMVTFDCRGIEPIDFSAREGWTIQTVNEGSKFDAVDLTEGEWEDFCDKIFEPVSIFEIQHNFKKVK